MFQPSVVQDFFAKGRSYEAHPQGLARPFFGQMRVSLLDAPAG